MDSSIHAHLISQYVQDRVEQAERLRVVERRGVRLPRIAWPHTPRRRAAARYGTRLSTTGMPRAALIRVPVRGSAPMCAGVRPCTLPA